MKKAIYYWLLAFAVFSFAACSSDEDTTPSMADVNAFAPGDDDGSTLANIRREFYKSTGSYLLFNDTLSVKDGEWIAMAIPSRKFRRWIWIIILCPTMPPAMFIPLIT